MNKLDVWVPHTLSEKNKDDHIIIATSLLSRQRNYLFLKNISAGDEIWVFYDNVQCKGQCLDKDESLQPFPKAKFHERKIIVCVW